MNEKKHAKITKQSHAFKDNANSYNVGILNSFNPELQLKDTESAIRNKLIDFLIKLKGFQFITTLVLEFKKIQSDDKILYSTFYLHSKPEVIINESDIGDVFKPFYSTVKSNIQKSLGQGLDWLIDSVKYININISRYNPFAGISYIQLQEKLDHPRGLLTDTYIILKITLKLMVNKRLGFLRGVNMSDLKIEEKK